MSKKTNVPASHNKEAINLRPNLGEGFTIVSEITSIPLIYRFDGHSLSGVSLFQNRETAQQKANEINNLKFACRVESVPDVFRFCVWAFCCANCDYIFVYNSDSESKVSYEDFFGMKLIPSPEEGIANSTIHDAAECSQYHDAVILGACVEEDYYDSADYQVVESIMNENLYIPVDADCPKSVLCSEQKTDLFKYVPKLTEDYIDDIYCPLLVYTDAVSLREEFPDVKKWIAKPISGKDIISQMPKEYTDLLINSNSICLHLDKDWLKKKAQEVKEFDDHLDYLAQEWARAYDEGATPILYFKDKLNEENENDDINDEE